MAAAKTRATSRSGGGFAGAGACGDGLGNGSGGGNNRGLYSGLLNGSSAGGNDSGGSAGNGSSSGGGGGSRNNGTGDGSGSRNDGRGALDDRSNTIDQLGAGDGVAGEGAVNVEADTLIAGSVERGSLNTRGAGITRAGDGDVEALRIILSTVEITSAVEGNDLMTENVVSRGNIGGNLNHPAVIVGNELVGGPLSWGISTINQAGLGDLEELERGLVNSLASLRTAVGEVVDDGTVVALGPSIPLNKDLVTSGNNGMGTGVFGVLMTDDVGVGEVLGTNEAVVGVGGSPGSNLRRILGVREYIDVVALVGGAVDDNVLDVAMGSNRSSTGKGGEKSLGGERRHLEKLDSSIGRVYSIRLELSRLAE